MTSSRLPDVTLDETMFLHTVLSRDKGHARAKFSIPSPRLASLVKKRLIDFICDNDGADIVMTPLGIELVTQSTNGRD